MKVTGIPRPDGKKDYRIVHEGRKYLCERQKTCHFRCNGYVGSIKFIKALIQTGQIDNPSIDEAIETKADESEPRSTWDCIHPCALLTMLLSKQDIARQQQVMETLDAYGWLAEDGSPDYRRAMREEKRVLRISATQAVEGGDSQ